MQQFLHPNWLSRPIAIAVIEAFASQNTPFRFVGGCVRDALMGLDNASTDLDACTPATPDKIINILQKSKIRAIPTGIEHGTITAVQGKDTLEITTLRADIDCNGRHAEVAFTDDWEQDAKRRDFTINAIYLDINNTIHDYHEGLQHLEKRQIYFIGNPDERIKEDYLRILRYFRFLATHGNPKLPIDDIAIQACKDTAPMVATLSGERVQQEMKKILASNNPAMSLTAMQKCGLGEFLFETSKYECIHTTQPHVWLRLALLLRSANKSPSYIIKRWKLSRNDSKLLKSLCNERVPSARFINDEWIAKGFVRLHGKELAKLLLQRIQAENPNEDYSPTFTICQEWQIPTFPVNGNDLKDSGIPSGKDMGIILKSLEEKWEKSHYLLSKDELLENIPMIFLAT